MSQRSARNQLLIPVIGILALMIIPATGPELGQALGFSTGRALAQTSFDPVGTFVPLGQQEAKSAYLARTLKNEQELKFRTRVLGRPGVVVVEFSLPTCPACDPAAKSIIEILPRFGGRVDYIRLDLNKNLGLSYRYDVPEVPAVLVFKDGELAERYINFKPEQKQSLSQLLAAMLYPKPKEEKTATVAAKNRLQF